ncbi:MAG: hypothetical protein R3C13_12515 [Hyphomonas sp.]|uniref:hypothetical protein n=1 Tax=Hyphomonas sp. TaxID=87 RepID=UPI003528F3B0
MNRQILISISNLTPHMPDHYMLSALMRLWREKGLQVECNDTYAERADVCILHHDKTRLNQSELAQAPAGTAVLNGNVLDISKTHISVLRTSERDDWNGPVIVKTDLNHFGVPEGGKSERIGLMSSLCSKVRSRLSNRSWRLARQLPPGFYPVLRHKDDVPGWVWNDDSLIVEKFLPERTGDGLYGVRGWIFFGDKEYAYRNLSPDPLVKVATTERHEFFSDIPENLRAIREQMGFDYGKFDYVEHDGKAFLLDANKTPSFGHSNATNSPRIRSLAEGIEAYI